MGRKGAVSEDEVPSVPQNAASNNSGYQGARPKTSPVSAMTTARMASVRRRPHASAQRPMTSVPAKSPASETVTRTPMAAGDSPWRVSAMASATASMPYAAWRSPRMTVSRDARAAP
jgi:hypothetical protein